MKNVLALCLLLLATSCTKTHCYKCVVETVTTDDNSNSVSSASVFVNYCDKTKKEIEKIQYEGTTKSNAYDANGKRQLHIETTTKCYEDNF